MRVSRVLDSDALFTFVAVQIVEPDRRIDDRNQDRGEERT